MKNIKQLILVFAALALSIGCATGPSAEYKDATTGGTSSIGTGGGTSAPATCINSKGQTVGVGIGDDCSCGVNSTGTTICDADGHWGSCTNCTNTNVPNCTPGSQTPANSCTCTSGATGRKTCNAAGSAYGDCQCNDKDGDGYNDSATGGTDCNDNDATVHPGAAEVCGGPDKNCDNVQPPACPSNGTGGATSVQACTPGSQTPANSCTCTSGATGRKTCNAAGSAYGDCQCNDKDGDGYNDSATGGTDCNDNDATVHPGAAEVCGGPDKNCDNVQPPACTVNGTGGAANNGTGGSAATGGTTSTAGCLDANNVKQSVGYFDHTCTCTTGGTGKRQCIADKTWTDCYQCNMPEKDVTIEFTSPIPLSNLTYIKVSGGWGNNIVTSSTAWEQFCITNSAYSNTATSGQLTMSGSTITCVVQVPQVVQYIGVGIDSHTNNADGSVYPSHQQDQYSPWQPTGNDAQTYCGSSTSSCLLLYGITKVNGKTLTIENNAFHIGTWLVDSNFSISGDKITCVNNCGDWTQTGGTWIAKI